MATTKKKNKPKCTKGTPCGFSCIGTGKICRQPIEKEKVEEVLTDIPEVPVPKNKAKKKKGETAKKFLFIETSDGKIPVTGDGPVDKEEDAYMDEKELYRVKKELAKKGVETEIGEAEKKAKTTPKSKLKKALPDDDTEAIQEIKRLDSELGTENYTPVSELRKKFPDSTDKEFQDRLNKLSKEDYIEISEGESAEFIVLTDKSENLLEENPLKYKPSKPLQEIDKDVDKALTESRKEYEKEIGEDLNYTPIFKIREKLKKKGLSREDVDQALYRLSRADEIEFSSLVDPTPYTEEQVNAGIPKEVGGSLFFIVDNRPKTGKKKGK